MSRVYGQFGDGHDEPPSPITNVGVLLDHLILEVPGKNQHIVGTRLANLLRRIYGDMSARRKPALLVRTAVHDVIEEIGSDGAVIQQRIALGCSPIGGNGLAVALG